MSTSRWASSASATFSTASRTRSAAARAIRTAGVSGSPSEATARREGVARARAGRAKRVAPMATARVAGRARHELLRRARRIFLHGDVSAPASRRAPSLSTCGRRYSFAGTPTRDSGGETLEPAPVRWSRRLGRAARGRRRADAPRQAVHAILSPSSLIFRIPVPRICEGSRIWPEYRLHSIVFAYRSIACMLLVAADEARGGPPRYFLNLAIVLGTMAAADLASRWVGPRGRSKTIQMLDAPGPVRYFFSVMQFHATAGCLVGVRRYSTQFAYVFIIQLACRANTSDRLPSSREEDERPAGSRRSS